MKTLYLDCGMGAAGDMLTAALLEVSGRSGEMVEKLNRLGIPGVTVSAAPSVKCGITGTHVTVLVNGEEEEFFDHDHEHPHDHHHDDHDHDHHDHEHHYDHDEDDHGHHHHSHDEDGHDHHHDHDHGDGGHHHHHHSGMHDIEHLVRDHMDLPEKVREDVLAVYGMIAEAEGHVHNMPVDEIHFHEVGTMDAVADVAAVCLLMHEIAPDRVVVSPVHVGSGQVRCAHGILPVPAPATAYILRDVPIYSGSIRGELCTPTGAALLKYFADEFGSMPAMRVSAIGYGMGKKDFEAANCVRAMLGETKESMPAKDTRDADDPNLVYELSCNVDDMTAEQIAFATERFFEAGAFEAYTIPIGMKKGRPGTLIRVMCSGRDREKIAECIFKYTSTIGIREVATSRYTLERKMEELETSFGIVRRKTVSGYGVRRSKLEYEDLAAIARSNGMSIEEVRRKIEEELA